MKYKIGFIYAATLLFLLSITVSCGNGRKKELNHLLLELAADDHTIDHKDWTTIADYLNSQKADFTDFYDDEAINTEAVKNYITEFFANRRPRTDITFIGIGTDAYMTVKFYLERSGSMTPYDAPEGDGLFKASIVNMLNNLPDEGQRNKIFVVNNAINEYPEGLSKFLADNNIFDATKGIGDPSYTDFASIFSKILKETGRNEISILVSDMIYSTKNMQGVNAQKVFNEIEGMTNAVFKGHIGNTSVLIIKMHSSYNGQYYSYNAPTGTRYDGNRPYYIMVVGSKENMARLTTDNSYSSFYNLRKTQGYENEYLFETSETYHPFYSLLLNHQDIKGRFRPNRGQNEQITSINSIAPERDGDGNIQLVLAVDLSRMFINDDYLVNPDNYKVEADDDIVIKQIKPIDRQKISPAEKKYAEKATHLFVISMKELRHDQDVKIKLLNRLPSWVEQSSSDDDTNTAAPSFSNTTFGLKYLLRGIYNCYHKDAQEEPYYFSLNMKFEN